MIEEVNGFFKPTKISHREEQLKEFAKSQQSEEKL